LTNKIGQINKHYTNLRVNIFVFDGYFVYTVKGMVIKMIKQAKPIFLKGRNKDKNLLAGFCKKFTVDKKNNNQTARISARSFYRMYINGEFVSFGPARTQHGYSRVDEYDITAFIKNGENIVAFEVIGYNSTDCNHVTFESSMLVAEIECNGKIICATDENWKGIFLEQKRRNTEHMGFGRRVPLETYYIDDVFDTWKVCEHTEECEVLDAPKYLPRGVLNPDLFINSNPSFLGIYSRIHDENADKRPKYEWWGSKLPDDTEFFFLDCNEEKDIAFDGMVIRTLGKNKGFVLSEYTKPAALDFDFQEAIAGHVGIDYSCTEPVTIDIIYNDIVDQYGNIPAYSDATRRILRIKSDTGNHKIESIEFEFIKYIKVIIRGGGEFTLNSIYVRHNQFPDVQGGSFICSDNTLNRAYEGAKRTLLTCTLDFFMDCPERERGGWSGDSYWTGRAMRMINGDNDVEKAMLENFLISNPLDNLDGSFCTCCGGGPEHSSDLLFSWNLFIMLELTDYYKRTADKKMVDAYRPRIETLLKAIESYQNEFGLIENPPGGTFIDWSGANDLDSTTPISLATNVLFAVILKELSALYDNKEYQAVSDRIINTLYELKDSIYHEKFLPFTKWPYMPDSLICKDGKLTSNGGWSEASQYYLFWLGYLNINNAPELLRSLTECFGPCPERYRGTGHLSIKPSGFFFGYMVRFEMLSRTGQFDVLADELKHFSMYLLDNGPGTYWETLSGTDSLDHGFGAHIGVVLIRDFLGLDLPDQVDKVITVAPHPCFLEWAKGSTTVENSIVSVKWEKRHNSFVVNISVPGDYTVDFSVPDELMHYSTICVNGKEIAITKNIKISGSANIEIK